MARRRSMFATLAALLAVIALVGVGFAWREINRALQAAK